MIMKRLSNCVTSDSQPVENIPVHAEVCHPVMDYIMLINGSVSHGVTNVDVFCKRVRSHTHAYTHILSLSHTHTNGIAYSPAESGSHTHIYAHIMSHSIILRPTNTVYKKSFLLLIDSTGLLKRD